MHPHLRAVLDALASRSDDERRARFLASLDDRSVAEGLARLPWRAETEQLAAWMAGELGSSAASGPAAAWTWTLACTEWGGRPDACDVELGLRDAGGDTRALARTASAVLTRTLALGRGADAELLLAAAALLARSAFERLDARLLGAGVPVVVEDGRGTGLALGHSDAEGWDDREAGYFEG